MLLIVKWLIMTVSVMIAAYVIPGVTVRSFISALWVALLLGIVNMLLRPFLILITLPINILTLGLFTFVINGVIILLVSSVIKGFQVSGFWIAVLFSIALSIVNYVMNFFIGTR